MKGKQGISIYLMQVLFALVPLIIGAVALTLMSVGQLSGNMEEEVYERLVGPCIASIVEVTDMLEKRDSQREKKIIEDLISEDEELRRQHEVFQAEMTFKQELINARKAESHAKRYKC